MDALTHFLAEGWIDGLKPNPGFDPLLHGLRHPGLGAVNPLADAIVRHRGQAMPSFRVSAVLSQTPRLKSTQGTRTVAGDPMLDIADTAKYAGPMEIGFEALGRPYKFLVPAASDWLGRLEQNRPFAAARISHGDWDAIRAYRHYARLLAREPALANLTKDQIGLLTVRLCDEWHHDMDVYAENVLTELFADLDGLTVHDDFLYCAAFKGYPTADERLFEWSLEPTPEDIERLELFASYFAPGQRVYDATVWKRWMISGGLRPLPGLLRHHPVILMAADELASLGERWALPWFLHIPIPATGAYQQRHDLLGQCRDRIAEAKAIAGRQATRKPVFLMQGSSLAYWFMKRLFATDPDVFYLDFGQALHPWFYDCAAIPLRNWGRLYGPTIVRNTGLEDYYKARGVKEPVIKTLFKGKK